MDGAGDVDVDVVVAPKVEVVVVAGAEAGRSIQQSQAWTSGGGRSFCSSAVLVSRPRAGEAMGEFSALMSGLMGDMPLILTRGRVFAGLEAVLDIMLRTSGASIEWSCIGFRNQVGGV